MAKRLLALGAAILIVVAAALFQASLRRPGPASPKTKQALGNSDLQKILAQPARYRGKKLRLHGQIAADPEYDSHGTHLQVYLVFGAGQTYVVADYPAVLEVTQGDFVAVTGVVGEAFAGQTDDGQRISSFRVKADRIGRATAEQALAPATTVWTKKTGQVAGGLEVIAERVEFAASETRFYMKVRNLGSSPAVSHVFNSWAAQDGQTLGLQPNDMAGYDEIAVDIPGGGEDTGVLVFPPLWPDKPIELGLKISDAAKETGFVLKLRPPKSSQAAHR